MNKKRYSKQTDDTHKQQYSIDTLKIFVKTIAITNRIDDQYSREEFDKVCECSGKFLKAIMDDLTRYTGIKLDSADIVEYVTFVSKQTLSLKVKQEFVNIQTVYSRFLLHDTENNKKDATTCFYAVETITSWLLKNAYVFPKEKNAVTKQTVKRIVPSLLLGFAAFISTRLIKHD